jgi:hypothetical protein
MRSILIQSFVLISLIILELCPGQFSKFKNEQKAITPTLCKAELRFVCTTHLHIEIYLPTKFHVDISYSFTVMCRTRFSKRGDNSKKSKTELWSFGSALHLNALYHCVQFKQIMPKGFQVMLRISSTDEQTDNAATICSPFGEH